VKCPVDTTPLHSRPYEGNNHVDECSTCQGIWLTKEKLFAIEQSSENDYDSIIEQNRPASVARIDTTVVVSKPRNLDCPACNSPLTEHEHGYFSGIMIDSCISCGGVWLDKGELQALEIFFETHRSETNSFWAAFQSGLRFLLGQEK